MSPTVNISTAHVCFFIIKQLPEIFLREVIKNNSEKFREAQSKKMYGLFNRGTFEIVLATSVKNYKHYSGKFINKIKNIGTPHAYKKFKFVVQAFNNREHGLLTHAPIV